MASNRTVMSLLTDIREGLCNPGRTVTECSGYEVEMSYRGAYIAYPEMMAAGAVAEATGRLMFARMKGEEITFTLFATKPDEEE